MKKIVILLSLLILIPGVIYFAVTLLSPKKTNEPITLNYWGVVQDESSIKSLIDKYTGAHPLIKIEYHQFSLNKYRETLQSRIKDNSGPDLFRFHNTWTAMLASQLAPIPALVMDDNLIRGRFYPVVNQDLKVNGKVVGIPLDFDGLALIYNTQAFSNAALVSPPTDWYQFRQYARKLTTRDEKGNILVAGAALGTSNNVDYFSDILGLMFLQNGTKMITNKEVSFDKATDSSKNNLGADALTFYVAFAKDDNVWNRSLPNSIQAFAQGKVNMIFAPAAKINEILKLTKANNPPVPFKVAPVPQLPEREEVSWASFWAEGVSNKSSHQKEAWDFINYLADKDSLQERFNLVSNRNGIGLPFSRMDMANEQSNNPYLGPFVSEAKNAQSWYLASGTFDNGLNDKIIPFFASAVNTVLGNAGSDSALKTAALGVGNVLASYNLAVTPTPPQ